MKLLHALPLLLVAATASAEPIRIRMAAVAPEGSSWAHEFHTVDRDVQRLTNGEVQLKWYLGGIAGDELTSLERVRRGQLDGVAGAMFCDRLAPSMRVGRVVGLFQNRDEWDYVMSRLLPDLDKEFAQQGFANLGIGSFGNIMFFSRQPIRTIEELKHTRFWTYDLDQMSQHHAAPDGRRRRPGLARRRAQGLRRRQGRRLRLARRRRRSPSSGRRAPATTSTSPPASCPAASSSPTAPSTRSRPSTSAP